MTIQRQVDSDLLASIQLFEGLVAIVCAQVAFLQFFEGGIDGVAAGASIVECPFRHVVNDIQECLFVNAPILNGFRNVNSLLQIFGSLDPVCEGLIIVLALEAAVFSQFDIAFECLRILY